MTNDKSISRSEKWLGQGKVRYVLGIVIRRGTSDCSGFTQYVFRTSIGVQLGDWTGAQVGQGKQVPDINHAQPGI